MAVAIRLTLHCDGAHKKRTTRLYFQTLFIVHRFLSLFHSMIWLLVWQNRLVFLLTIFCDSDHTAALRFPTIITSYAEHPGVIVYSLAGGSCGKRTCFNRCGALQGLRLLRGVLSYARAGALIRLQLEGLPSAARSASGKMQWLRLVRYVLPGFRHLRNEECGREKSGSWRRENQRR